MKHLLFILILMASLCMGAGHSRSGQSDFTRYASTLLDSTLSCYRSPRPGLFNETWPRQAQEKATYLAGEDTLQSDRVAYLWPTSGLFSALNVLYATTSDLRYLNLLNEEILPGLACYYDTVRKPECYQSYLADVGFSDRFYDDNIWLGIDFTETFLLTGDTAYLDCSRQLWHFIESGRDTVLQDGIYWCEQKKRSKNTCSNAPASVWALKLYSATYDSCYLDAGKTLYDWTRSHLQDPADHLYWDNISVEGHIAREKYAYNSGQMLQAAVLLHRLTGEAHYLDEALQVAEACFHHFFRHEADGHFLRNGNVWFVAVMLRGFEELYRQTGDRHYVDAFATSLQQLWQQNRHAHLLFDDDHLDPQIPVSPRAHKWLLTQAALIEMFARLGGIPDL